MGVLKERWSNAHPSGSTFYDWFVKLKAQEFLESVISPVRQRGGLGYPPERFITNRSERTNGVIQEFVRQECDRKKVDEYVFATTLRKLVDIQEKEIALALIGLGEYKLRDKFKHIYRAFKITRRPPDRSSGGWHEVYRRLLCLVLETSILLPFLYSKLSNKVLFP
jgi:hypothetical protein